jgi:hypothetical protein
MTKAKFHRLIRKSHRYLGIIFGIQFLFWTLGGLYFSWTNIKNIRGEDIRKEEPALLIDSSNASLATVIRLIKQDNQVQSIKSVNMADVLGKLYYQITYHDGKRIKTQLADAKTAQIRMPLSEQEAISVAKSRLKKEATLKEIKYLSATNNHHEYREKPLPAYAITFSGDINTTVYVSTELGTVQSFRNKRWRLFDFFWMTHTMDYQSRDNINNWVLRIFSALGLITIISGFLLYIISFKKKRKYLVA